MCTIFLPAFVMPSKHVKLINNCFPKTVSEKDSIPDSNSVSYLVYYLQSNPTKMVKVSPYLKSKFINDFKKTKYNLCLINLKIWQSIIMLDIAPQFFVADFSSILRTSFTCNIKEMYTETNRCFGILCTRFNNNYKDDIRSNSVVIEMINRFCDNLSSDTNEINVLVCEYSLRAIVEFVDTAIYTTTDISASNTNDKLTSAIIFNISDTNSLYLKNESKIVEFKPDYSNRNTLNLNNNVNRLKNINTYALLAYQNALNRSTYEQIKMLTNKMFIQTDKIGFDSKGYDYCFKLILFSLCYAAHEHVHIIFMKLMAVMSTCLSINKNNNHACLLDICIEYLTYNKIPSGVTVMEVLDTVYSLLNKKSKNKESETPSSTTTDTVVSKSIDCISCLALKSTYNEQLNDILCYLVNRLNVSPHYSPTQKDQNETSNASIITLETILKIIHKNLKEYEIQTTTSYLNLNIFATVMELLISENIDVKIHAFKIIHNIITNLKSFKIENKIKQKFVAQFCNIIPKKAHLDSNSTIDYLIIYLLMQAIITNFDKDYIYELSICSIELVEVNKDLDQRKVEALNIMTLRLLNKIGYTTNNSKILNYSKKLTLKNPSKWNSIYETQEKDITKYYNDHSMESITLSKNIKLDTNKILELINSNLNKENKTKDTDQPTDNSNFSHTPITTTTPTKKTDSKETIIYKKKLGESMRKLNIKDLSTNNEQIQETFSAHTFKESLKVMSNTSTTNSLQISNYCQSTKNKKSKNIEGILKGLKITKNQKSSVIEGPI